jgi:hypothetical protein
MSKKAKPESTASDAEPVSEPLFATDERVTEAGWATEASVAKYAAAHPDEPSATPAVPAKKAVPAPSGPLTAAELVEVGLKCCDDGLLASSAAVDSRRSVLESVAAMILAAR